MNEEQQPKNNQSQPKSVASVASTTPSEKVAEPTNTADSQKPSRLLAPWLKIAILVISLLAITFYLARNLILGKPVDAYPVLMGELTQAIVTSGRILTPQRISVAAEVSGRVDEIAVEEGQKVKKGQLLIRLNEQNEYANLANANATLLQAHAKLRQLREVTLPAAAESLSQVQSTSIKTNNQWLRTQDLFKQGFISQAQVDEAKRSNDIARSQVVSAQALKQSIQSNGSDSALALSVIAQANASLQLAQLRLKQDAIYAPADGVLISRNVEVGDMVQPTKELMQLAGDGETQILIQLDEKNLAKLALGQQVIASADAYSAERFNAVVSYINPGIDATRGSVSVKMIVPKPPSYIRQDMTVSVDIETAHHTGALVVPTGAVRDSTGKSPWIMVVRNKKTFHQAVVLGLRGDNRVEILSGIRLGEPVILSAIGTITADMRVRPKLLSW